MSSRESYIAAAADGLTVRQTAERLGVAVQTVRNAATRFQIVFSGGARSFRASKLRELEGSGLTAQQARDVDTLIIKSKMTRADAVALVTRPKARVPLRVPPDEAKRILSRLRGEA